MKRIVCLLLALVLTTGALPLTTFAEGECTCTTACTEESRNESCEVCNALGEGKGCPKTAPVTPGPTPTCNCTSKCTAENSNQECEVCKTEGATCGYVEPVTYTVTYKDSVDPANFDEKSYTEKEGSETPAFDGETPTRANYIFNGWSPKPSATVTESVTYTAQWAEARTITYKSGTEHNLFNDETYTAKDGDTTPAFSRDLNSFTSWKIEEWNPYFEDTVNENATYTAVWEAKGDNKLVLDANGGTVNEDASLEKTSGNQSISTPSVESLFAPPANYKSIEDSNNHWNTKPDGTGAFYADNEEFEAFTAEHNEETVTLYAQWEPKTENKPPVDEGEVKNLLEEDEVKIAVFGDSEVSFTEPAGSALDSWEVKGNDVAGYTLEVTLSFDDTLEGQCKNKINDHYTSPGETTKTDDWKFYPTVDHPRSQTVTFSYGEEEWKAPSETTDGILATFYMNQYFTVTYTDGVDSVELFEDQTTSVAKGADTPQFTGIPTRTGYGFDGWNREVAETVTADVTYTARWKANTYTVKFHANGGSGTMADQTLTYDVEKELTKNAFTRKGYKFTGWADKKDTNYADEEEVKNLAESGTVTLYAQWIPSVERVDFSLSGYGYKKEITSAKVSPGENLGVSYGTGYDKYGDNYGITNRQTGSALSSGTFANKKDYYLYVKFYVNQGYTHEDLTKDDVFLDGVPALSLTGKEDQAATQALDDEAGTELTAVFKLKTIYLIKASAGKNGAISPKDTVAVFQGDDVTFTITPDKGYVRSTLKVDDKKVTTAKTYTFKDVQASHTIRATFAKDSGNAKTGDDLSVLWALAAAILSAAALATVLIIAKKKKK